MTKPQHWVVTRILDLCRHSSLLRTVSDAAASRTRMAAALYATGDKVPTIEATEDMLNNLGYRLVVVPNDMSALTYQLVIAASCEIASCWQRGHFNADRATAIANLLARRIIGVTSGAVDTSQLNQLRNASATTVQPIRRGGTKP